MTDQHPSLDDLADLAAGVSGDSTLREHVTQCATCTEDLAQLARVSADLSALPPEPMPMDVADRIDTALREAAGPTVGAGGTVVPLSAKRRSRIPNWALAAAVVVTAVGGAAVLVGSGVLDGLGGGSHRASDSAAAAGSIDRKGVTLTSSGVSYTRANLGTQVGSLLGVKTVALSDLVAGKGAAAPEAAPSAPTPVPASAAAGSPMSVDSAGKPGSDSTERRAKLKAQQLRLTALANPKTLAECLTTSLGTDLPTPRAVDRAVFDGEPALIVIYPATGPAGRFDVYVVDPTCPVASFVFYEVVALPTPR